MKVTKQEILQKAITLFNKEGYSFVSYRRLARELDISHSNLIYHFKDKNVLVEALHDQLLSRAIEINVEIKKESDLLKGLLISIKKGFKVLFAYRFFMLDFNHILKDNKKLHEMIKNIESLRYQMYNDIISDLISSGIMKPSHFENEYVYFIKRIRVYSDYWISSTFIYDNNPEEVINEYVKVFIFSFYPYLTETGKIEFDRIMQNDSQLN